MSRHRISLHCSQTAIVNCDRTFITFEDCNIDSMCHFFTMTRDQFFAFDDVLTLIYKYGKEGNYPLGLNMWFYYHHNEGKFRNGTRSFNFLSLQQYIKCAHDRLVSLFRQNCDGDGRTRERRRGNNSAQRKRPLSATKQSSNRSSISGEESGRKTLPRSTINVELPSAHEDSAIFHQRDSATPRWRSKSASSTSSSLCNLSPSVSVCLDSD